MGIAPLTKVQIRHSIEIVTKNLYPSVTKEFLGRERWKAIQTKAEAEMPKGCKYGMLHVNQNPDGTYKVDIIYSVPK